MNCDDLGYGYEGYEGYDYGYDNGDEDWGNPGRTFFPNELKGRKLTEDDIQK